MRLLVQGVDVYLVDRGQGPPTLFLHGNPDSSDLWRGLIERLHVRLRCLAPDLPGFGRSVAPADFDCSLENLGRFVDNLLGAVGVTERVNLVMHDFGGPFGLAWAVKHPDRGCRLVVMNTSFFADYRWHVWARVWRTPVLGEISMAAMNRWGFARAMRKGGPKLSDAYIDEVYRLITPAMKRMVLRLYRATDPGKYRGKEDQLLELTKRVPTLVVWGDRDPYIDKGFAERFGAQKVIHFPEAGHWVPVEEPEPVATLLEAFLGS
jgi:pimeloyl-ACP methyl ester carboxylesterase